MSKKAKIILLSVLSVLVVFVVLWDLDIISFGSKKVAEKKPDYIETLTPEQKQEMKKEQQQRIEWEKTQPPPQGS